MTEKRDFSPASIPATGELPARGTLPDVEVASTLPEDVDALILPIFTGDEEVEFPADGLPNNDHNLTDNILGALKSVGASGTAEKIVTIPSPEAAPGSSIIAVGLGDASNIEAETVRRAAGAATRAAYQLTESQGATAFKVATTLSHFDLKAAAEGALLGGYRFPGIRSGDKAEPALRLIFSAKDPATADEDLTVARIAAEATAFARELVNTPSNELYPETYAAVLRKEAEANGVEVEVLDEEDLAREGFGGILAVGRGSARPPRLVRLSWKPKNSRDSVALVGKGITFDSGGISLKPGSGMWDMIMDMGGSASVAAATIAAARLKLPVTVTATVPLAENMPSGSATRPGDVITHYGGITSEILNTDAEGRVVLADAIARACEDEPSYLIDTATLTGAQMVALGDRTAGVMGTDEFRDEVAATGRSVGENAWAMPLLEEHEEDVKSPIADIRNINAKREGGMEYAATYLSRFVSENIHWTHIDVAGPAWNGGSPRGYHTARATGVPTRTIIATLQSVADSDKNSEA